MLLFAISGQRYYKRSDLKAFHQGLKISQEIFD